MSVNGTLSRKLRGALVGGGQGSFIGKVHSIAFSLDNRAELVAGAFSSDPERSKASGKEYGVDPSRAYGSYKEMLEKEKQLPEDERIDFVSVVTPNHVHYEVCDAAVKAGFDVVCDKPMTFDLAQSLKLQETVENSEVVFALTHNYTGYPLVRQARDMILNDELGQINAIRSSYIQGWLRSRLENDDHKQAAWRTDPAKSGAAGAFGDIATHAFNLGQFMTGDAFVDSIACTLKTFVNGRELDDYGTAIVRYQDGMLGTVTASQISHGRENDLSIEVDGTKGSLSWRQENPNELIVRRNGEPHQIYTRNPDAGFASANHVGSCRLPGGHPEAFFEAFANVYTAAFDAMIVRKEGTPPKNTNTLYPNVSDGVDGLSFITTCVESSQNGGCFTDYIREA